LRGVLRFCSHCPPKARFVALLGVIGFCTLCPMIYLRQIFVTLMAVVLLITGLGLAMGRGAMAADGQLCTVTGTTAVVLAHDGLLLLDDAGDPITLANPICADCVLSSFALTDRTDQQAPIDAQAKTLAPFEAFLIVPPEWRMGGEGRGPPAAA